MKNKTLYIIGNGKTFNPDYFKLLKKKDTFGMNLGFYGFEQHNFTPTYYGFYEFERHIYKICEPEILNKYLENNNPKTLFLLNKTTDIIYNNIQYINHVTNGVAYDMTGKGINPPLNIHLESICNHIGQRLPNNYKEKIDEIMNNTQLWGLNYIGIVKYLSDKESEITSDDFITSPRIPPPYIIPKSFDQFYWSSKYNSSIMSVLIGIILGYRKFVLLGMDSNFKIKDKTLSVKDNYWFDAPPIKLNNLSEPHNRTYNNIHTDAWWNLQHALMINNIPVEITNASIGSSLCNIFYTKHISELV